MTTNMQKQIDPLTSIESEAAVLGAMMLDRSKVPVSQNMLHDEYYFSSHEHRQLYRLFLDLNQKSDTGWDLVVFRDQLKIRQQLEAVGGVDYLVKLIENVPHSESCQYYAEIVLDKYQRRRLCDYANGLKTAAQGAGELSEIQQSAEADFRSIIEEEHKSSSMTLLSEALDGLELNDSAAYISSGFESLDKIINGLGSGHFIIVAGRPGMGKTSLLLNMAARISKSHPVGFFSLEMTSADLMQRLVCSQARVSLTTALRSQWLGEDQRERLEEAKQELKGHQLIFDESRLLTPARLRNRIYILQKTHGIRAVFVDYLQLLSATEKSKGLYEAVTMISKQLKSIALQLEIPVVVGCQLNRSVEQREVKTPRLSDLRDSGSIEQDADVVLLLNRPSYYKRAAEDELVDRNEAEVIVAKNRRGYPGDIKLRFLPEFCLFDEKDYY